MAAVDANTGISIEAFEEIEAKELTDGFIMYCLKGNIESVKAHFLHHKLDESRCDDRGYNCLHIACVRGDTVLTKLLLKQGAQINNRATSEFEQTPLHLAVIEEQPDIIRLLMSRGANPLLSCGELKHQPIHSAVLSKNLSVVKALLSHETAKGAEKTDCLAQDSSGMSAFYYACLAQQTDIVDIMMAYMLSQGKLSEAQKIEITQALLLLLPLPSSAQGKSFQKAINTSLRHTQKLFFSEGNESVIPEKFKQVYECYKEQPLNYAALCGDKRVFEALYKLVDSDDLTFTLEIAVRAGSTSIVEFMIEQKACDMDSAFSVMDEGLPICYIPLITNAAMTKILLPHIKKVKVCAEKLEYPPLGYAVVSKQLAVVKLLLAECESRQYVVKKANKRLTALQLAVTIEDNLAIVSLLLDHHLGTIEQPVSSADKMGYLDSTNHNEHTALFSALARRHFNSASLILERMTTKEFDLNRQYILIEHLFDVNQVDSIVWLFKQPQLTEMPAGKRVLTRLYLKPKIVDALIDERIKESFLTTSDWLSLFSTFFGRKQYEQCEHLLKIDRVHGFFGGEKFPPESNYKLLFKDIDIFGLRFLIEKAGLKVDAVDENGFTPLFYVVKHSLECTAFLLKARANPHHKAKNNLTALATLEKGFVGDPIELWQLRLLLDSPAVAGYRLLFNFPLQPCQIVEPPIELSKQEQEDEKAWFQLIRGDATKEQLQQWLQQHPHSKKWLNNYFGITGQASIHILVFKKKLDCISLVVKHGANIFFPTRVTRNTVMHQAALNNYSALATILCQQRQLFALKNCDKRTPIMEAVHFRHFGIKQVLDILLKHRPLSFTEKISDLEQEQRKSLVKLHRRIWCDYPIEKLQELLMNQAIVAVINKRDFELDYTAVEIALVRARAAHLQLLLKNNARIEVTNRTGQNNILHLLFQYKSTTEEDMLATWQVLEAKISRSTLRKLLQHKNGSNLTPIELASRKPLLCSAFKKCLNETKT
ncbi:MAG: ankyrin repeat domain-containing protein [Parashewanella sp.]